MNGSLEEVDSSLVVDPEGFTALVEEVTADVETAGDPELAVKCL